MGSLHSPQDLGRLKKCKLYMSYLLHPYVLYKSPLWPFVHRKMSLNIFSVRVLWLVYDLSISWETPIHRCDYFSPAAKIHQWGQLELNLGCHCPEIEDTRSFTVEQFVFFNTYMPTLQFIIVFYQLFLENEFSAALGSINDSECFRFTERETPRWHPNAAEPTNAHIIIIRCRQFSDS